MVRPLYRVEQRAGRSAPDLRRLGRVEHRLLGGFVDLNLHGWITRHPGDLVGVGPRRRVAQGPPQRRVVNGRSGAVQGRGEHRLTVGLAQVGQPIDDAALPAMRVGLHGELREELVHAAGRDGGIALALGVVGGSDGDEQEGEELHVGIPTSTYHGRSPAARRDSGRGP